MKPESPLFKAAWISLAVIGVAIFLFGLVVAISPGPSETQFYRAIGVAYIGMGIFGILIAVIPFRRGERWAWFSFWYYPVFWLVHLLGNLPPGQDHIHQAVFIILSLAALLVSVRAFFPGDKY
jgi:uncharacterized membrane protein HdeD (DUF308 family)